MASAIRRRCPSCRIRDFDSAGRALLLVLWVLLASCNAAENNRPIIGIVGHPSTSTAESCEGRCELIAASYVKWVEAAGARAVPIPFNASEDVYDALLSQINGLLLPGGDPPLSEGSRYAIRRAIRINVESSYFPVWGTCLGFEWLTTAVAADVPNIVDGFDASNVSLRVQWTPQASGSRVLAGMSAELRQNLSARQIVFNNHHLGIEPVKFAEDRQLSAFYDVLATSVDRKGRPFVATIEGKGLPLYGVQWHPEKSVFEWGTRGSGTPYESIDHSAEAIEASQVLADFFVDEARKSSHRFESVAAEDAALFYNYPVTKTGPGFEQTYYVRFGAKRAEKDGVDAALRFTNAAV